MNVKELFANIPVLEMHADPDLEIAAVRYDSRKVTPGDLFIAIRGYATDGHKYIPSAVEKGAALVVAEEVPPLPVPYILVKDARRTLAMLGAAWYGHPEKSLRIVGVTGTNGKTTTTTLLKKIIEDCTGDTVGLIGTNQNMIGQAVLEADRTTPESFELYALLADMRDAGCRWLVMEVSSHALYLDRVWGLHFDTAVFTNLSRDHLDFHKTMENYRDAKAVLFTRCDHAVINIDDPAGETMLAQGAPHVLTYSADRNDADLAAKNIRLEPRGVRFEALMEAAICRIQLHIPGKFSVYNALAAVGCGISLGFSLDKIADSLYDAVGVKGRAEVVPVPADYTVLIDYAHSPDSMENILRTVRGFCKGRIIGLFGCGGDRDRTKRPIMGRVAGDLCDVALVTSDNPRSEDPMAIIREILPGLEGAKAQVVTEPDRITAIHKALDMARADDVVLLMGKGHETYQEVNGEKHHMDEREIVAEHFAG